MENGIFKWSLIGASGIAQSSIVPAILAQANTSIASVVSSSLERAASLARAAGAAALDDLDTALSDPSVDAVYISSVNSSHYEQTLAAVKAGKHIMCEKPLALTAKEATIMAEAAKDAGVLLATNHHMRNSVPHEMMRRAIAKGNLGTIVGASVRHAVQLPQSAQGWRTANPEAGAGVILDITVHDADVLRYVLGSDPETVYARARSGAMTAAGIDESVFGVAHFADGTDVSFFESFISGHAPTELSVFGTEAAMVGVGIQSMQPVGSLYRVAKGEATPIDLGPREDLYTVGFRKFQAAAQGRQERPAATAEDGIWSLAFAEAALRSVQSDKAEPVRYPGRPTPQSYAAHQEAEWRISG
jgi:1,5-anhydro-D-fructose reductase (1,5-anhydro-D-mannitol-forming)